MVELEVGGRTLVLRFVGLPLSGVLVGTSTAVISERVGRLVLRIIDGEVWVLTA